MNYLFEYHLMVLELATEYEEMNDYSVCRNIKNLENSKGLVIHISFNYFFYETCQTFLFKINKYISNHLLTLFPCFVFMDFHIKLVKPI